jgi:hypothetical protein
MKVAQLSVQKLLILWSGPLAVDILRDWN